MGYERPLPGLLASGPVLSLSRITLENNGKIRPQPDRENTFAVASGGGNGTAVEPSLDPGPSVPRAVSMNTLSPKHLRETHKIEPNPLKTQFATSFASNQKNPLVFSAMKSLQIHLD